MRVAAARVPSGSRDVATTFDRATRSLVPLGRALQRSAATRLRIRRAPCGMAWNRALRERYDEDFLASDRHLVFASMLRARLRNARTSLPSDAARASLPTRRFLPRASAVSSSRPDAVTLARPSGEQLFVDLRERSR